MRKYFVFFFSILTIILSGCKEKQKQQSPIEAKREGFISFDTLKVVNKIPLDTMGTNSPELDIEIELLLPREGAKEVARDITAGIVYTAFGFEGLAPQEAVDSFINCAKKDYYTLRNDYINEKEASPDAFRFNAYYKLGSKAAQGRGNTLCYTISNETYSGGAHPASIISIINFDTTNGKEIQLQDIIKEGCDSLLTAKLTTRLAEQHNLSTLKELQEAGFLTMSEMYVTNNFALEPDSLFFLYNSYEIAPYALGISRIGFTYDELKEILK